MLMGRLSHNITAVAADAPSGAPGHTLDDAYFFFGEGFARRGACARSEAATSFCGDGDLGLRRILDASEAGFLPVAMSVLHMWLACRLSGESR